ncbi:MAG: bifunctional non-ous end joining protein LigD, partial [Blastocatellia bacterium]|nr:bifunctional non-ous end joining protein LigD [Blastocatellia bacterium]
ATLVDAPFSDPDWIFETKWDGFRSVCFLQNGKARFVSRNQLDMSAQYPELAKLGDYFDAKQAILDGEIVALDEHGRPRFQLLQPRHGRKNAGEIARLAARSRIVYYVFDLLYHNGYDLTACALVDRKAILEKIIKPAQIVSYSFHIAGDGEKFFKQIEKFRLEGMMAKRAASTYVPKRSNDWLKVKTIQRSEVVVGGYTKPRNSREYFGALVAGLYRDGQLHYVGHTGGGFNRQSLKQIFDLLQPLKTNDSPFAEKPPTNEPVQWVTPALVAEVKFSEWTADHRLRHPIFVGLREDKRPQQCKFEVEHDVDKVVKQGSKKKQPAARKKKS